MGWTALLKGGILGRRQLPQTLRRYFPCTIDDRLVVSQDCGKKSKKTNTGALQLVRLVGIKARDCCTHSVSYTRMVLARGELESSIVEVQSSRSHTWYLVQLIHEDGCYVYVARR